MSPRSKDDNPFDDVDDEVFGASDDGSEFPMEEPGSDFTGDDAAPGEQNAFAAGENVTDTHGTIRIGKREWAVALLWLVGEDEGRKNAIAKANEFKAQFYCVRKGHRQIGLGTDVAGHRAGMPSLAAQVFGNAGDVTNMAGVFALPDGGYYVLGVHEGNVLPDFDSYHSTRETALEHFQPLYTMHEWERIYAPVDFGFDGTEPGDILAMTAGRRRALLAEVAGSGRLLKILLAGIAGAALMGGLLYYQKWSADREYQLELERIAEANRNVVANQTDIVIPPAPWEGKAKPLSFITRCFAELNRLPAGVAGWENKLAACADEGVAIRYEVRGGSINWILAALDETIPEVSIFTEDGITASATWPLSGLDKIPVDQTPPKIPEVRRYLLSQFGEAFITLEVGGEQAEQFYKSNSFTVITERDPRDVAGIFDRVPGLFIKSMQINLETRVWTLEAQANEQLPPPPPTQ